MADVEYLIHANQHHLVFLYLKEKNENKEMDNMNLLEHKIFKKL